MTPPRDLDLLIVGAGPCGLAAAISAQRAGLTARVLDAGSVVSTITQYPYYVGFFSTAEKLSLGGGPFVVARGKTARRARVLPGDHPALPARCAAVRARDVDRAARRRVRRALGDAGGPSREHA